MEPENNKRMTAKKSVMRLWVYGWLPAGRLVTLSGLSDNAPGFSQSLERPRFNT